MNRKYYSLVFFYKDRPTLLQGRATALLDDTSNNVAQEWYSVSETNSAKGRRINKCQIISCQRGLWFDALKGLITTRARRP